jgi:hypothetical protein
MYLLVCLIISLVKSAFVAATPSTLSTVSPAFSPASSAGESPSTEKMIT